MSIKNKAIAYGDPRYGRSCANCVYREQHPVFGSRGGEIVPDPVEVIARYLNQGELF